MMMDDREDAVRNIQQELQKGLEETSATSEDLSKGILTRYSAKTYMC